MAWNEPGNGQRDPWNSNRRPAGGKSSLDAALKELRKRLGKLGGGRSGLTILAALVLVWLLLGSYTVVGADQSGVLLCFGRYQRTLEPGFHFKLPPPIESVSKVVTLGVRAVADQDEMLTRDGNFVSVNFNVQYQIADVRKFLFASSDPQNTLREAAEAAVRKAIGSQTMDALLAESGATAVATASGATSVPAASATSGSPPAVAAAMGGAAPANGKGLSLDALQQQIQQSLQHTLEGYGLGLQVTDVSLQNITPPPEVQDAFDDVNAARQDRQTAVNQANAYAGKVVPQARGEAARILAAAQGDKAARIARAQGDAAQFDLLLQQYRAAPDVTRRRLWLETMQQVLADGTTVIDGSNGHDIINLPSGHRAATVAGPAAASSAVAPASPTVSGGDAAGKEKQP